MGIYLRGATMPSSCRDCAVGVCLIRLPKDDQNYDRHPQCPLVEVKEPHGDLIDKSRVYDETLIYAYHVQSLVSRIVDCAPTVIKAEGE